MAFRSAQKILLLGWDGADWRIIQPLLDAGKMPYLEQLINRGAMGNLATLKPIVSPMLWTSVATGKRADRHGILGFTEPLPDGSGVRPVSAASLKAQPLWNIVESHGLKSAVVGWFATHPAQRIAGTVVSDLFAPARGADFDQWPLPEYCISPPFLAEIMSELRIHPSELPREQVERFIPNANAISRRDDERLSAVVRLLAQCTSVHAAGTWLAENGDWDLLAVYYETIDRMCHWFMECRAPQLSRISDRDFQDYKDVIDEVYQFHDLMLGRYMRLCGPLATIVIVSDHGFLSGHMRPPVSSHMRVGNPVQWHRDYGVFLASGPGIKSDELVYGASLLDIAPTVLAALGLPVARDMEGRVLARIFTEEPQVEFVDSYGVPAGAARTELTDLTAASQAIKQLVALGYIEKPAEGAEQAVAKTQAQNKMNLAEVLLDRRDYPGAAELLVELSHDQPDNKSITLRLAQCRLHLGDVDAGKRLVDGVLAAEPDEPWARFVNGLLLFARGEDESALAELRRAEAGGGRFPNLHYRMGAVCLRMRRWLDAEAYFRNALGIDPDNALALDGLGVALYRQGRTNEAERPLVSSVGLLYFQPLAHYHLGLVRRALGREQAAIDSFEIALSQRPDLLAAHGELTQLFAERDDLFKVQLHQAPARIRKSREQTRGADIPHGPVVVVSGLPRSGTSMMMQMLAAGGVPLLTDGQREPDVDNPKGYFELQRVAALARNSAWLNEATGRAVKIISSLLYYLPGTCRFKVIFMRRDLDEVLASQASMLRRSGEGGAEAAGPELVRFFQTQFTQVKGWLESQANIEVLFLEYAQAIAHPREAAEVVRAFLGLDLDVSGMAAVVDPALYRRRNPR